MRFVHNYQRTAQLQYIRETVRHHGAFSPQRVKLVIAQAGEVMLENT